MAMDGTNDILRQVGALPMRKGSDGSLLVLLVTTLQTRRWTIPKGWPWPDREDCDAAAEEAREEAGVLGEAGTAGLGSYTYEKRQRTGAVPVLVTVYPLEVREELDTWPECERRQRAWFTLDAAAEAAGDVELRNLLLQLKAASDGPAAGSFIPQPTAAP
jgi:8-oxo-dGTP pyrophosphatase MutT (NUDIX family)